MAVCFSVVTDALAEALTLSAVVVAFAAVHFARATAEACAIEAMPANLLLSLPANERLLSHGIREKIHRYLMVSAQRSLSKEGCPSIREKKYSERKASISWYP